MRAKDDITPKYISKAIYDGRVTGDLYKPEIYNHLLLRNGVLRERGKEKGLKGVLALYDMQLRLNTKTEESDEIAKELHVEGCHKLLVGLGKAQLKELIVSITTLESQVALKVAVAEMKRRKTT